VEHLVGAAADLGQDRPGRLGDENAVERVA
jgi:hypothetical protein